MTPEPLVFDGHTLDFSTGAKVMGILNITPDSFYDGGTFHSSTSSEVFLETIIDSAKRMEKDGADILDIGGESTRPGAEPLSAEDELNRVIPVISALKPHVSIPISIDTYKARVAKEALKAGASMVNDISGFRFDLNMAGVCSQYNAPAILMHAPKKPRDMNWSYQEKTSAKNIFEEISEYFEDTLNMASNAGVSQIILDVGFGFGKTLEENYQLMAHLDQFSKFNKPLLAGLSRKSFIGKVISNHPEHIAAPTERLFGTVAANAIALLNGAHILRVHDVKPAVDAIGVVAALKNAGGIEHR